MPIVTERIDTGIEYSAMIAVNMPSADIVAGIGVPTTVGCSEIIPILSGPYRSSLSQCSGPGAENTQPRSSFFGLFE